MACVFAARIALRRSLRSSCLAARRAYSNGGDGLPLTFATPTQVRLGSGSRHRRALNRISLVPPPTPQAFYDNANVKQVDVCCTSGSFGILPEHVPSIAVLKPGLLTVYEQDKMAKYFGETVQLCVIWACLADRHYAWDFYSCLANLMHCLVMPY